MMLSKVKPLVDACNSNQKMQLDPLLAKLYDIFTDLRIESDEPIEMATNPLKHHISADLQPFQMYTQLINKICKENS